MADGQTPSDVRPAPTGVAEGQAPSAARPALKGADRKRLSPMARDDRITFWCFLSPWLIGFVLFGAGPILASIVRDGEVIIPRGRHSLQAGDEAIVFALADAVGDVTALFPS